MKQISASATATRKARRQHSLRGRVTPVLTWRGSPSWRVACRYRIRWRSAAVLVVTAMLVAGCGGSSGGRSRGSLVLYNGQHPELTNAIVSAFERANNISVRQRTNNGVVLADQILGEGKSSPADVYLTENSPELVNLSQHGLLAKLPQSILDQVPAADRSADGTWVGVALRVSALVYNPSLISRSQLPPSIVDLASPEWKGKVAVAPLDSDFQPVVGAVIAKEGKAAATNWLAGVARNAAVYQDDESVVTAVNRGDEPIGVINQYYWYRLRREIGAGKMHSAIYYFPNGDPGSVVNVSGAAVLASSHHRSQAQRLVAFFVSHEGQRLISVGDDFEYPVRPGVGPNPQLPPFASIPHSNISVAALGNDVAARQLVSVAGFGSL
jgi:iron(III) transport system substrate-binding protein